MKDFAQRFYSTWYKAVKLADPHHLVLGSRIPYPMDEIVGACAANTDVLSFNHYAIELHKDFDRYSREFDKPMLIGEYGFDSFDAGLLTAYVPVASQKDRGKGFTYYTEQCAAKPYFVGAHYFQYIDEPLTGRGDGETSFNGFVAITDSPYPELVKAAKMTNARIYQVHSGKEPPSAEPPKAVPKKK
jgi:agarase